ncbi:MAG: hypothetical protein IT285_12220 [Bdellovibrionales bacterium]|nr:hypothetical protein [Bdellovibrionales bacterium]
MTILLATRRAIPAASAFLLALGASPSGFAEEEPIELPPFEVPPEFAAPQGAEGAGEAPADDGFGPEFDQQFTQDAPLNDLGLPPIETAPNDWDFPAWDDGAFAEDMTPEASPPSPDPLPRDDGPLPPFEAVAEEPLPELAPETTEEASTEATPTEALPRDDGPLPPFETFPAVAEEAAPAPETPAAEPTLDPIANPTEALVDAQAAPSAPTTPAAVPESPAAPESPKERAIREATGRSAGNHVPIPSLQSRTEPGPPAYLGAPHPENPYLADVWHLFRSMQAPPESELRGCAAEFGRKLAAEEAMDRVRKNPRRAHWCFYRGVLDLESTLKTQPGYLERKEALVRTYSALVPLARAFAQHTRDARYLQFAASHYSQVSEWILGRRVVRADGAPEHRHLDRVRNPWPTWRPVESRTGSVLERYGVKVEPERGAKFAPPSPPSRVPAGELVTPGAPLTAAPQDISAETPSAPEDPVQTSREAPLRPQRTSRSKILQRR